MGLSEVSKVSAAQAQQTEQKPEIKAKQQENNAELSQALSKGQTSKDSKKAEIIAAELKKKEGLSTGAKLGIGAAALLAAGSILKFVKPSAGKALMGAAKLASHAPQAQKGLKASHALGTVGGLAGVSILAACSTDELDEIHNHYVDLPSDTVTETEYVEKIVEKPVYITKTDTVYKTDTIGIPEIIEKTDTLWQTDTIRVPEIIEKTDTIWKTDTVKVPEIIHDTDTIWKTDTIKVPEYIEKTDTVWQTDTVKVPEYITKWDTVYQTKTDTQYIDRPIYIEVPGETIYVKEDFESEVPDKMKEMLHDLGIDTTGVGKFVYGLDWQDAKNNQVHRTLWDGGRTSRDGDVYIMNDIGTKWSNPDETYVFGKNEEFRRHELYLDTNKDLNDCVNLPKDEINVSNGNGAPNWFIFDPSQPTSEPGNWNRQPALTFTKIADGVWQSSDGFTYEKGDKPNSIKKTNQHGSEWLLKDVSIIGGDDAKDPQE